MGFGLITAGLIFLVNPILTVFDILPDAVGFFLIFLGLRKLSLLNDSLFGAKKLFIWLVFIDLVKPFTILLFPATENYAGLLLSTIFAIIETILTVCSLKALFEGVESLGLKYGSSYILNTDKNKKDNFRSAEAITVVFIIIRNVFTVIPELTELAYSDNVIDGDKYSAAIGIKPLLYIIEAVVVIALAVFFVIKSVLLFKNIKQDNEFISELQNGYNSLIDNNKYYYEGKKISVFTAVMLLSVISIISLIPDNPYFLPSIVASLISLIALTLKNVDKKHKLMLFISSAITIMLSVITIIINGKFHGSFELNDIFSDLYKDSYSLFMKMSVIYAIERIFLLLTMLNALNCIAVDSYNLVKPTAERVTASNINTEELVKESVNAIKRSKLICSITLIVTVLFSAAMPFFYYLSGYIGLDRDTAENPINLLFGAYTTYFGIFAVLILVAIIMYNNYRQTIKDRALAVTSLIK